MALLQTDTFWALVALVLFLAVMVYFKVPAWVNRSLDSRAKNISNELDEARRLREEAQQLLAEYQRKRASAEKEAENIISIAKREAELMAQDARKKTEAYVVRRNQIAEQKIAQAELEAVQAVRSSAVDIAVAAASEIIANGLDTKKTEEIFKNSLQQVKTRFN